jgi:hypothetical protein
MIAWVYILAMARWSVLFLLLVRGAAAQFAGVPPAPADTLQGVRSLPAFEAKDIDGHVWRNNDFRGKYTLVYFWHTFEARAVDAHTGYGQEQIKKYAGLPDLAELQRFTFSIGYDFTHTPPT